MAASTTRPPTRRFRRVRATVATTLLLAVLASACASFEDADSTVSSPDVEVSDDRSGMASPDAPEPAPVEPVEDAAGEAVEGMPVADAAPTGQRVIRTAEVILESADTAETLGRVRAVAERAGGYTATSDLQRNEEGVVRGTVTLRVPTDQLDEVVAQLEELGEVVPLSRTDERDVTVEHADLQARIENLTAYETELRALLAQVRETTDRPEDLLHIFERIRSVREEIDLLEGRLAALSDRIAYATVTVTLRPLDDDGEDGIGPWSPGDTFQDALAATGRLLTALGDAVIWFVVTGIPVLLSIVVVPAGLIYLVFRRLRRTRDRHEVGPPEDLSTAPPPPAPAG